MIVNLRQNLLLLLLLPKDETSEVVQSLPSSSSSPCSLLRSGSRRGACRLVPDALDLAQPLQPVGRVRVPVGDGRLLDLGGQVAVQGQLAYQHRQVAIRYNFRVLETYVRYGCIACVCNVLYILHVYTRVLQNFLVMPVNLFTLTCPSGSSSSGRHSMNTLLDPSSRGSTTTHA